MKIGDSKDGKYPENICTSPHSEVQSQYCLDDVSVDGDNGTDNVTMLMETKRKQG